MRSCSPWFVHRKQDIGIDRMKWSGLGAQLECPSEVARRLGCVPRFGQQDAPIRAGRCEIGIEIQGASVLFDGLTESAEQSERFGAQPQNTWLTEAWFQFECAVELSQRKIGPLHARPCFGQVRGGKGIVGSESKGAFEVGYGSLRLTALQEYVAQPLLGAEPVRVQASRLSIVTFGFVERSAFEQQTRHAVVGDVVALDDREGVREERVGVAPVTDLSVGHECESGETRKGYSDRQQSGDLPARNHISGSPCERRRKPDHRDVHVAIRMCLESDRHQPDDRHEGSQEPEPATGEERSGARLPDDDPREGCQQCDADQGKRPARPLCG